MSRKRAATPIAGFAVLLVFSSFAFSADPPQDQEPPLLLYLEAEGQRITIELDKPFDLAAIAGKKTATLRAEPYRVFPYAGLSFRYPSDYSFEAEQENDRSSWTLDGNSCVIMVHHLRGKRDHEELGRSTMTKIIEEFAGAKTRELATELAVKGRTLKGPIREG